MSTGRDSTSLTSKAAGADNDTSPKASIAACRANDVVRLAFKITDPVPEA
jgi:hypothetical protein